MSVPPTTRSPRPKEGLLWECAPELLDGWMVHCAALERGLNTWLMSGQALLVGRGPETLGSLAFAHGVPQETQLSMATVLQDKRVRRAILEDHKVPIPRGATFTVGRGFKGAQRFATKLGYPVVVKPMVGDNTIETMSHITSPGKFKRTVQGLGVAPQFRTGFTASSYAFTAIQSPREDGSRETRDNYRYLVEKQVRGHYVRTLTVHQELVSAVYSPGGAWGDAPGGKDVLGVMHPSFATLAERVCAAFPGAPVLAVDFVASNDLSHPVDEQRVVVVEVSERPWLHLQRRHVPEQAYSLGGAILKGSANYHELAVSETASPEVAYDIRWEGVPDSTEFLHAVKMAADRMSLQGRAQMEDPVGGIAVGHIEGSAAAIALLSELALAGNLDAEPTMSVISEPSPWADYHGFKIEENPTG